MLNEEKIAAIYTRVSTTDQAREGHSLEEQEARLRKLCEAKGYKVYAVYTDAGISGKSTENRPEYKKMMVDMKKGKINLIMAYKMDRISRSVLDFEEFFIETKKNNCGVELLHENIDTSGASGMMFARILTSFAQFERELTRERTLVGVESAVNKGHFGGIPPLGYMSEVIDTKKTKKWFINEETANMVKEIFDLCLKGKTYFDISNIMKEKYPSVISSYRTDKDTGEKRPLYRSWSDGSISTILNNKCYIGIYEYRKRVKDKETIVIEDIVPRIIEDDVFYECQENIKRNMRNYYRDKQYLFMQKLLCPTCGRLLACSGTTKTKSKKDYLYYRCKDCKKNYFREDVVEKALMEELAVILELYLVLENNYIVIDNDTAKELNKGKIDNTIRYAMDTITLEKRLNNSNCNLVKYLWNLVSYEVKCKFIQEYIDTLKIKKYKVHGEKDPRIKLLDLKLKPSKLKKLFGKVEKNMIDFKEIESTGNDISEVVFSSRKQADDYIEVLRKKYNIKVIDMLKWEMWNNKDDVFKMISIVSKRAVEKNNILFLELVK